MATINTQNPSLLDVTRTLNPDGTQADIAEILTQDNEVLADMVWKEGNLVTGDRITVRTSRPTAGFRRLYEGVARSKTTARQMDEAAALLEANSFVDREAAILSQDLAKFRMQEGRSFMEIMNETMAQQTFYGNQLTNESGYTGLAPRFGSVSSGPTVDQVLDGGGTGTDNRSIWLIVWATDKVYGIYPKGTVGGLMHMDTTSNDRMASDGFPIGDEVLDANGRPYLAYKDHYQWRCGLGVKDPRYVVRIANIDFSNLTKDLSGSSADIQDLMVQAVERIQGFNGRAAFYMGRSIRSMLRRQLLHTKNAFLSLDDAAGRKVLMFDEVPVRRVDALSTDEARVV